MTPLGRVPVSLSVGAGLPVAVTVKLPAVPTVNVVALALGDAYQRAVLGIVEEGDGEAARPGRVHP